MILTAADKIGCLKFESFYSEELLYKNLSLNYTALIYIDDYVPIIWPL